MQLLGDIMSPKRVAEELPNGTWRIHVTPPAFMMGGKTVTVDLNPDQYQRYLLWRESRVLIQNALPELSLSEREKLMSGLDDAAFKAACGPEEDDE